MNIAIWQLVVLVLVLVIGLLAYNRVGHSS